MATVDAVDAFSLLQNMAPLSFDSSRLVDVACIAYAHIDHAYLRNLRSGFEASVSAQVQVRNFSHPLVSRWVVSLALNWHFMHM